MASATEQLKAAIAADDAAGVAAAAAAGAGVNGNASWRPLCAAAEGGKAAAFAALRDAGADAALLQDGRSVLRFAVFGGNADVIRAAAAMRADVAAAGITPLQVAACAADDGAAVAAVLTGMGEEERRAAVNAATSEADRGLAPLHLAAAVGNVAAAAGLVDAGAGVEARDALMCAPLVIAAMCGRREAAEALICRGVAVNARTNSDWTSLHLASQNGHTDVIDVLIAAGAAVDARNKNEATPLYVASQNGHVGVVGALLGAGAAVDARDKEQWTPLHIASQNGHVDVVSALVGAGAAVDARQKDEWTPLHFASRHGHAGVVGALVGAGAAVDARNKDECTPLHLASQNGHAGVVGALLGAGADVDVRQKEGATSLHLACFHGHVGVVNALLGAGATVDVRAMAESTPLHVASQVGCVNLVVALVGAGAAVDARDKGEWTPLLLASQNGHVDVVGALLGAGAAVDAREKNEWTPLHVASKNGYAVVVDALLAAGAAVDSLNEGNVTPLHVACHKGDVGVVDALLGAGAAVDARDEDEWTPLHVASAMGHAGVVSALLGAGAAVDARDKGEWTPLHLACHLGHVGVVGALVVSGAPVDACTKDEWTPLLVASAMGHAGVVAALLAAGAAVNACNKWNETPLHSASQNGHVAVVEAFVRSGASIASLSSQPLDFMLDTVAPGVKAVLAGRADVVFVHVTPLHLACLKGHTRAAASLIALGAPPSALDSQGRSPCMYAAMGGHAEAFHLLLPRTVATGHLAALDALGRSLLHYAAAAASKPIVLALLAAGADPLLADGAGKLPVQLVPNTAAAPIDGDAAKEAIVDALQTAMARLAQARGDSGLLAALTQSRIALPVTTDEAITAAQIAGCTMDSFDVLGVTRRLGGGAYGEVWAATIRNPHHGALEREVDAVVKRTHWPATPADAAARSERAFWREVVMQHACRTHRGVARCYGGFIDPPGADGWARGTMVMERCAGSLEQALMSLAGAPQPLAVRQRWALQALAAFAYLHGRDIVHGDIKSANVLVMADGEAKVTDFGMCALRREETAAAGDAAHVGERGSPAYMCPAVALGLEPLRKASDVYSCGVLLWELLSGSRAHGALDIATLPPPPADLDDRASAWVRARGGTPDAAVMARFYCAALRGLRPATPEQLAALRPAGIGEWIAAMWHPEPRLRPTLEDALPAIAALLGDGGGDAAWSWPGAAAGGAGGRRELPTLAVGPGGVFGTAGGVADGAAAAAAAPTAVPTALESVWMGSRLFGTRPATGGVTAAAAPSRPAVAEGCGVEECKEG
jgi:ankyrin repeat protein